MGRRSSKHDKHRKRSRSREKDREERKSSSSRHKKRHRDDEEDAELKRNKKLLKRAKEFVQEEEEKKRSSSKRSKKLKSRHDSKKRAHVPKLDLGPKRDTPPEVMLNEETDYFRYHDHLRIYLATKGLTFENLSSEESHLPDGALNDAKRTNHKWGFKTTETERKTLGYVKSGVKKQTEYNNLEGREELVTKRQQPTTVIARQSEGDRNVAEDEKTKPRQELERKHEHRRLKERIKVSHEEMGYTEEKTHGHERKLEKRREQSAKQHGSAAQKEEAAFGGVEVSDRDIYGGSDDYKRALDREKIMKERLKTKKAKRLQELEAKEKDKQSNMLKSLGLSNIKPGQKISIAPRNDP